MDIASLGIRIEATGLDQAAQKLDKLEQSGASAEKAAQDVGKAWSDASAEVATSARTIGESAEAQSNRLREMVSRSLEVARANGVASESQRSIAERAKEAALGIDKQKNATVDWAAEQAKANERVAQMEAVERRAAAALKTGSAATAQQTKELQKLIGQIDPTVAKLERLAQMEAKLDGLGSSGALKPQVVEQYRARIEALRTKVLDASSALKTGDKAAAGMAGSLGKLNLKSVETQQSAAALVRSLATGQWGQAQASLTSLTARTGALGGAFSAAGIAILGAGAAVVGYTALVAKGYLESRKLEGVILATGSAAGVTASQVERVTRAVGKSTGAYQDAAAAAQDLLLSGKATADTLESVLSAASSVAILTGQSIQQATNDISSLSDGGADALRKLNERYNFLTFATYEHIRSLREQGREQDAVKVSIEELERVMSDRAKQMQDSAGLVESAWRGVKNVVNQVKQAILDVGRTDLEARIQQKRAEIQGAGSGSRLASEFGVSTNTSILRNRRLELQKELDQLLGMQAETERKATQAGAASAALKAYDSIVQDASQYATREQQRVRAITEARGKANDAIVKATAAGDTAMVAKIRENEKKILAGIEERFKSRGGRGIEGAEFRASLQEFRDALAVEQGAIANSTAILSAQFRARLITADEYYTKNRQLVEKSAEVEERALTGQIELLKKRSVTGKDAADTQRQIGQLEAQLAKTRADNATKLIILGIQEKEVTDRKTQALQAYTDALDKSNIALQRQMDSAVNRVSMGEREFEIQSRVNDIYAEQADRLRELSAQLSNRQIEQDVYDQQVDALRKATEQRVQIVQDGFRRMDEAQANWLNGAKRALADYATDAADVAGKTYDLFSNAFRGLEEVITDFLTTGKGNWKDYFDDVGRQITKFIINQQLSKFLKSLSGEPGTGGQAGGGFDWGGFIGQLFGKGFGGVATGGLIRGAGSGTSDSIPARLSNGEFVIKAASVQKYGAGFLSALNDGVLPQFSTGGLVNRMAANDSAYRGRGDVHMQQYIYVQGQVDDYTRVQLRTDAAREQRRDLARNG